LAAKNQAEIYSSTRLDINWTHLNGKLWINLKAQDITNKPKQFEQPQHRRLAAGETP
jgi:hypothetical protein